MYETIRITVNKAGVTIAAPLDLWTAKAIPGAPRGATFSYLRASFADVNEACATLRTMIEAARKLPHPSRRD